MRHPDIIISARVIHYRQPFKNSNGFEGARTWRNERILSTSLLFKSYNRIVQVQANRIFSYVMNGKVCNCAIYANSYLSKKQVKEAHYINLSWYFSQGSFHLVNIKGNVFGLCDFINYSHKIIVDYNCQIVLTA